MSYYQRLSALVASKRGNRTIKVTRELLEGVLLEMAAVAQHYHHERLKREGVDWGEVIVAPPRSQAPTLIRVART